MNRRRERIKRDRDEILEDCLRPDPRLGFNRDNLGMYFLGREADAIAETQFRRAVWVNPFEPMFKFHWALSLFRLGRYSNAIEQLEQVLTTKPDDADARRLLELCRRQQTDPTTPPTTNARSS